MTLDRVEIGDAKWSQWATAKIGCLWMDLVLKCGQEKWIQL